MWQFLAIYAWWLGTFTHLGLQTEGLSKVAIQTVSNVCNKHKMGYTVYTPKCQFYTILIWTQWWHIDKTVDSKGVSHVFPYMLQVPIPFEAFCEVGTSPTNSRKTLWAEWTKWSWRKRTMICIQLKQRFHGYFMVFIDVKRVSQAGAKRS